MTINMNTVRLRNMVVDRDTFSPLSGGNRKVRDPMNNNNKQGNIILMM